MKPDKQTSFDFDNMLPKELIRKSTIVYGTMMVVGLLVMAYGHGSLPASMEWRHPAGELWRLGAIGVLGAILLQILSVFFEDWFPSFRELKAIVMRLLGRLNVVMACYLAFITALGEEIVFRGSIQPLAGIFVTSILFGLMHVGPGGLLSAWSLWAVLAGALLGWIFDETKSLWPCILAHFLVNFVSMVSLRRQYQNLLATKENQSMNHPNSTSSGNGESDSRT